MPKQLDWKFPSPCIYPGRPKNRQFSKIVQPSSACLLTSPDDRLVGIWTFVSTVGNSCLKNCWPSSIHFLPWKIGRIWIGSVSYALASSITRSDWNCARSSHGLWTNLSLSRISAWLENTGIADVVWRQWWNLVLWNPERPNTVGHVFYTGLFFIVRSIFP